MHRLEPGQEKAKDLVQGEKITVPAVSLVGILERHGWNRGIPQDAGLFHEHTKPFVGANVTAVIQYPGIPVGYMVDWDDQNVDNCFFVPGNYTPTIYPEHRDALPLGDVDPVVISEVLGTLGVLRREGEMTHMARVKNTKTNAAGTEMGDDRRPSRGRRHPAPGVRGALRRRARPAGPRRRRLRPGPRAGGSRPDRC